MFDFNLPKHKLLRFNQTTMSTVTEEFRYLAKELSSLYQQRKNIAKDILFKEDRLRKLGFMLEFVDNLEENLEENADANSNNV